MRKPVWSIAIACPVALISATVPAQQAIPAFRRPGSREAGLRGPADWMPCTLPRGK